MKKPWEETWSMHERGGGGWRVYPDADEECATFWDDDGGRAHLAAAAPDMYRALELALSMLDEFDPATDGVLEYGTAALKKARGEK